MPERLTILERVKRRPLISAILAIATILGAVKSIIAGIEAIDGFVDNNIVHPEDLVQVKSDIIEEFRNESAEIRRIYVMDLQERIEELEDTLEETTNTGKQIVLASQIQELRVRIARLQGVHHD